MAKPITAFASKEQAQDKKNFEQLAEYALNNADGLTQTIKLLQELHESGILDALVALVQAKEKVAKIAVGQMVRPPVTNIINNAMAAAGALTELDPEFTKKLVTGLSKGMKKAEESMANSEKAGMLDLLKALKDPDINRTVLFGINLLKGIGEGLKD